MQTMKSLLSLLTIGCLSRVSSGSSGAAIEGSCYFPIEYQGTFLMQNTASINGSTGASVVSYSEITVEADSIPPWGRCHRRRGNTVFLVDSSGPEDCMRCFHLTLKTPNVIQIHAEGESRLLLPLLPSCGHPHCFYPRDCPSSFSSDGLDVEDAVGSSSE